jgi:hypothetical protein
VISREELEAAHCWENDDAVPRRPDMTAYRRMLRLRQARWREEHGHPVGSQPIAPKPGQKARPAGARMPLEYARETGANFVTDTARAAARHRTSYVEKHQSFDHQRWWADLLSAPALAVNLFAEADAGALWGGSAYETRYAYSPGRFDPAYLDSLRSFDAAFLGVGEVVAVQVNYHEYARMAIPKPAEHLARRRREVVKRSGAFALGAVDVLERRSDLCLVWLEHLLLLSMLQHSSGAWAWGRYVVVYPEANFDLAGMCARYRELLADDSTFDTMTIEQLPMPAAVRERYLARR